MGMPVISEEEKDAIKTVARAGLNSKVFTLARLVRKDLDESVDCDVDGVILEAPVGVPKLKQFGWSLEQSKASALEHIDYAKSHGLYVTFFGVDTTRAEPEAYFEMIKEISRSRADAVAVVDTFGCITVEAMGFLVRTLSSLLTKPLEVHTHNDFGLSTATTLAAVANGATVAHVAINGLGERTGNAPLDEVVMGLNLLYGVKTSVRPELLHKLSKLVEERSGVRIPAGKPFVGENAFGRESGISVAGWAKYYLGSEPVLPEFVGNVHRVLVGKKSGRHSIEYKLRELGYDPSKLGEEGVAKLLTKVKEEAQLKKRALTDGEFVELVKEVMNSH